MKNKKFLGGLVVLVVLLSGTTVLYFAGVERAGVTPAFARLDDGTSCSAAGGFCAIDLGTGGGCTPWGCCPQGQTSCGPTNIVKPTSGFRILGAPPSGSLGSCWHYPAGPPKLWCIYSDCTGWACPSACSVHPLTQGNPHYNVEAEPLEASCLPYM